ncbi:hypothetical protein WN55_05107 [Dufourea novaeangliae]|uniref:Uncharacterized protein n=1 Tax=Dufourea novaeangliae TaxID=178035 RepID=A0A154PNU6_DUFNO|nr:hypothetical protein WN55_05107 [Dufourea novaeangliae]
MKMMETPWGHARSPGPSDGNNGFISFPEIRPGTGTYLFPDMCVGEDCVMLNLRAQCSTQANEINIEV